MIAILYPLKMDKNLSEAYSAIYKEGTKYGLYKGDGKTKGAAKKYLDNKAKQLQKEYDSQSKEKKNNPAFQSNKLNPQPQYNSRYRKEWEALKLMEQEEYVQDFNEWKSGLVEEGYDISRWSESELVETFINEHDLWKSKDAIVSAILESDKKGKGSGKKDACYHKVIASASVWPSAYASGRLVQCRKKGAANYGKSSKKEDFSDWRDDLQLNEIIEKGTKGKIDFHSGKQTTDTGKKTKEGYPISQEKQVMKTKRVTVNNPKGRKRNESPMGKTIGKLNQVKSKQWKAEDKGDTKTAQKMYNRRKKLSGVLYDKTGNFYDRADND